MVPFVRQEVMEKLAVLPVSPGVYIFRGEGDLVLYIGKATSLRQRVRSYFQASTSDTRYFIPLLETTLHELETIVTRTEKEATILENELIKQYKPAYNVRLRDDKEYLSMRLDKRHEWPRLDVVRKPKDDGAKYFGPFPSATTARRTLRLVNKHFQLRTCSDAELYGRKRACLQYQIKRCPGPCVYEVPADLYKANVRAVELFLSGKHDELSDEVRVRMKEAAESEAFEQAANFRDQLFAIERVRETQRIVSSDFGERDILGLYREGTQAEVARLQVREGKLRDVATFSFSDARLPDDELLAGFISEHYAGSTFERPSEILLPIEIEGREGVEAWLSEKNGMSVKVIVPKRGEKTELLKLAEENAVHAFQEKGRVASDREVELARLKEMLELSTLPKRIECVDISHLSGGDTVGAVVVMVDGELEKKLYRTFKVRGRNDGNLARGDDYGAMYEVLSRRFRRGKASEEASVPEDDGWTLPDLLVVDGGKGQLAIAIAAAHDLGLHELSIVGLAKEKENRKGERVIDRIVRDGQKNTILVRPNSPLVLLARLRDEAHRFSNKGRVKVGTSKRFRSVLDGAPGVGDKTRVKLLRTFQGIDRIRAATDEELKAAGLTTPQVQAVRTALQANSSAGTSVLTDAADGGTTEEAEGSQGHGVEPPLVSAPSDEK
ncbi:MAG: excinuclease ABC subunit UvrC [Polyangiaceae bacterium]|nr:excinuclease ABC subunit UvrC [Polyangiaceae bacterium]